MPAIKIIVNKHTPVNIVVELNQSTFRQVTKVGGCFYELMQNSAYRPISKFVSLWRLPKPCSSTFLKELSRFRPLAKPPEGYYFPLSEKTKERLVSHRLQKP